LALSKQVFLCSPEEIKINKLNGNEKIGGAEMRLPDELRA